MIRWLGVVGIVAACGGGGDNAKAGGDGGGGGGDGGGIDPPACVGESMVLGDGASGTCDFTVGVSFDPGSINVVVINGARDVVCHTLRETGCSGDGWYWTNDHKIALCGTSCNALVAGGSAAQLVVETGCATASCGGSCTQSTGYCTHSTASQCCSGRCDGDSCGSGLWGPCPGMFGCFEGTCQNGFCRCPPGDLQCGADCVDPMTSTMHCGTCGNACTGGMVCDAGSCACPAGMSSCNGTCVALATDDANCGVCDRMCRAEQSCSGATCRCPNNQSDCNNACVDTQTDPLNCGACNNVCDATTEVCTALISGGAYCACAAGLFDCGSNGTCEDRMTDENNCGTCGRVCPGNKLCVNGDC